LDKSTGESASKPVRLFFRMLERCTLPSLATDISCLGKVHPAENMRELTGNLRECRNFQQEKGRETSN